MPGDGAADPSQVLLICLAKGARIGRCTNF